MSSEAAVANLTYLDEPFQDAPEPEIGASLPPGWKGFLRVESVEITTSKKDSIPMLKQELVVVDGEFADRTVWRNNLLDVSPDPSLTPDQIEAKRRQRLGFLKKDLRAYGIDTQAADFRLSTLLTSGLGDLLDRVVDAKAEKQKDSDNINIYLNEQVGTWDEERGFAPFDGTEAAVPAAASSGATPKSDPFATE